MASVAGSNGWSSIAAAKRESVASKIPSEWRIPKNIFPLESQLHVTQFPKDSGFFTDDELEITSVPAAKLLEKLHGQQWTAEKVFFLRALDTARALDKSIKTSGKPVGPLHGLPISLKDNFQIPGTDSTVGFVSWIDSPSTKYSALVKLLEAAGAVVYCKTTTPTAMMIAETVSNVSGRTLNPLNRGLTPGGSSGGESALIAFGGSVLGVGTDIGGSLRIPAACTGLFTLRPSFGRFPTGGAKSGLAGQEAVNSVNGPLARSLDDIELFAKTVVDAEPWHIDPKCLPIPWRTVQVKPKLKIGVIWHDTIVTPTPPVQRALKDTVEKLKRAGHELIDWVPDLHKDAMELLAAFFLADGGTSVQKILDPVEEPWRPEMLAYRDAKELGVYDMWQLQAKRTQLMTDYLLQWKESGVDALLSPTTPFASVEHGKFKHVGYTGVFNILDLACVSFPSGISADKTLDTLSENYETVSEEDASIQKDYSAEAVDGMPVGLQLIAQRLEEEKVIAMTREILKAL